MLVKAGSDIHIVDHSGHTLMHDAYQAADAGTVEFLKNIGARQSVFDAISLDDTQLLATLFSERALPRQTNRLGSSPLHAAVAEGKHRWVDFLLATDVDVNATDRMGNAPLHYAARSNCVTCIRTLVRRGANGEAQNLAGLTPLHHAAALGAVEALDALLDLGGNPNAAARPLPQIKVTGRLAAKRRSISQPSLLRPMCSRGFSRGAQTSTQRTIPDKQRSTWSEGNSPGAFRGPALGRAASGLHFLGFQGFSRRGRLAFVNSSSLMARRSANSSPPPRAERRRRKFSRRVSEYCSFFEPAISAN
jgi:ankyrin repeat protein